MHIWKNRNRLLLIFSLALTLMLCGCSEPSGDKALPEKDKDAVKQIEENKNITPAPAPEPETPQPAEPAAETPAIEPQKPEVLEIQTPEPAEPEPVKPEPTQPEPVMPEPAKPEPVAKKPEPATVEKKSEVADVIAMENPVYAEHKKGIVQFTHKKHVTDYKINCGECHHDDKGAPLDNLKFGDPVANCIACHNKPGQAPRVKDGPKLTKEQKREYHAEALHENCITCHKEYNKKNPKAAPSSCTKCHPRSK